MIEIASGLSAAVAGRLFADLGADVVRIEADQPSPAQPGELAVQRWARARKRILSTEHGPPGSGRMIDGPDLEPLVAGADVVISDLSVRRWGESLPSPGEMVEAHPGLVFVDATPFGRAGPYREFEGGDLVVLALSGYLFVCGLNDREPLRPGVDVVDILTGVNAAGGAMAALHHARRTGQGQVVEVSSLRTMLGASTSFTTSYSFQGAVRRRSSTPTVSPGVLVPCRDGHTLVTTTRTPSETLHLLLGDERLLDERFRDEVGRRMHQRELAEVMAEAAADKTMRELFHGGQALRLQNAMVQPARQTPSDPQHDLRHFFQPLVLDNGARVPAPVLPVVPVEARDEEAHRPGETVTSVEDAAWRQGPVARQPAAAPSRNALEGLKVVELTFAWSGPFMGRILGDHGATVVKVESRRYPDRARGTDLVDFSFGDNDRWMDRSPAYIIANPAKYHVGLDLVHPAGQGVLLDLVRWADVLIENFTPRVLPNLGLGWDLLQSVNPSLIVMSASGFGQVGPYRDYGAWGWTLECLAGITYATGYRGDPDPFPLVPTIPDPFSAATGVAAILAALEERRRSGRGQRIDLSQYECATFATLVDILAGGQTGTNRPRTGNRHAWRAPQGVYPSQGDDAWVAIAIETEEEWVALCRTIGRLDLSADEQLRTHRARQAEHDRIDNAIAAWTRGRTKHQAMHLLQQARVPAGAVQTSKDLQFDPHVQALEYFRAAWGSEIGLRIWPGPWYGMQATPGDIRRGTSTFGEDNQRVLQDLLGYEPEKVKMLLDGDALSDVAGGLEKPTTPGVPVDIMLERGAILSFDDDYRMLPTEVAERNQQWRRRHDLPDVCLDGRVD